MWSLHVVKVLQMVDLPLLTDKRKTVIVFLVLMCDKNHQASEVQLPVLLIMSSASDCELTFGQTLGSSFKERLKRIGMRMEPWGAPASEHHCVSLTDKILSVFVFLLSGYNIAVTFGQHLPTATWTMAALKLSHFQDFLFFSVANERNTNWSFQFSSFLFRAFLTRSLWMNQCSAL